MAGESGFSRPRLRAILLATLILTPAGACEPAPHDFPGRQLAERVESHLEREKARLAEDPAHYGLVFPVEQADLLAFMRQLRVFGDDHALVLGTAYGFESHGGGLLALLLEHWKPQGRAAELSDRFPFEKSGASIPLAAIYASHRSQIFLPLPGTPTREIRGAIPDAPQLARLRFQIPGGVAVEADAYRFLGQLIEREKDLSASWTNSQGQRLTTELLLEHARRYYLASRDDAAEPADHSSLHLVEPLLAASHRRGQDPEEIQQHFLGMELRRRVFDADDATLLLAHHAESLGRLLADPRVQWSPQETAQARDWLRWIEEIQFRDLAAVAPRRLTHLLLGLRLLREHSARLAGASPEAGDGRGADVVGVRARGEPGAYTFEVAIRSPDRGCDRYANWWEVVRADGTLAHRRVLLHSHPEEQPFTRAGGPVAVGADELLVVRGHLHPDGYAGVVFRGSVAAGFARWADVPEGYAAGLAGAPPQPSRCLR